MNVKLLDDSKLEDLKVKVKNCRDVVNAGLDHTGWVWSEYRRLQKKLALKLLNEVATVNDRGFYRLQIDVRTLGLLYPNDFPEGKAVIAVRRYRIYLKGRHTTACRLPSFVDLTEGQMPQYIHRFVF